MKHLATPAAWLAWVSVGTVVVAIEVVDRLLRVAPGRRLAAYVYTRGVRS